MIIIENGEGRKIPYTTKGNTITFDGELTLDLSRYERDFDVHLDICKNEYGMLTMGTSRAYVAQIDIPARRYILEDDGVDEMEMPRQKKSEIAFDPELVTLTLWPL